ncbi:Lar family restriction alleviation protein [Paracoccus sp. NGMCC 1.201697]|uniref:Lar family restriction alleviation protein n=1 Tax=Paracoccus broussonetiae subsp. drimophilus TaxID=3373869 RepID=A0ABW7LGU8_9RHOB
MTAISTEDLAPCPFCGGKARYHKRNNKTPITWGFEVDHWVSCTAADCCADMGIYEEKASAVSAWNRRTPSARVLELEAAQQWQQIETAPKGEITEAVGCRGESEWFLGRVAEKYASGRPPFIVIRRRAWPQEDSWTCAGEAYYVPDFFDAWLPIRAALNQTGGRG